eukprot:Skav231895  [mRNA]  locus=scaffold960:54432:56540:+ [translate_table: standard]
MVELFALLQAQPLETSWMSQVCNDVVCLEDVVASGDLATWAGALDFCSLARHCHSHPKALTRLGKAAAKKYQLYLQLWDQFRDFQKSMRADAIEYGLQPCIVLEDPQPTFFQCDDCQASFNSYKGLCSHAFKCHGVGNLVHLYAIGNCCRSCLKIYHSRTQLVHHLQYFRTGCLLHLIMTTDPLTDPELADIRESERLERQRIKRAPRTGQHKWPVQRAAGPLRPYPWQQYALFASPGVTSNHGLTEDEIALWTFQVMQTLEDTPLEVTVAMLSQHPYHGDLAASVTSTFARTVAVTVDQDIAAMHLHLQEAITCWKDSSQQSEINPCQPVGFSVARASIRRIRPKPSQAPHPVQPQREYRQRLLHDLWTECSVVHQHRVQISKEHQEHFIFPDIPRPRLTSHPIFVYVFSGRRRLWDYQYWIEHFLAQYDLSGRVLLLDLALSDDHDVGNPQLMHQLLQWLRGGAVAAMLLAPPCETWSEARFLDTGKDTDPRPLRSAEDPLGLAALKSAELEQLQVSNFLLYVALRLLLAAAVFQTAATIEHPREPKRPERASIWRLPWLSRLMRSQRLTRHLVWQARFGASSPKPTHLGVTSLPSFQKDMNRFAIHVDWTALQTLQGKATDGSWLTAKAKEYPALMNKGLAYAHVMHLKYRVDQAEISDSNFAGLDAQFQALYKGDVDLDTQAIHPDYRPKRQVLDRLD